jgi:uncharacterized protein YhaN
VTLAAAALDVLRRYPIPFIQVPEALTDIPLLPLFLYAGVAGLLWFFVLLFAIIKAIGDHRDKKALVRLRTQWNSDKGHYERVERELDDALNRRDHAQRYYEALRHQGGPYLPPEAEGYRADLARTQADIARLQGRLQAMGDPAAIDSRLDELKEQGEKLRADYNALGIAIDALGKADAQLHARFSPQLSQKAGQYFSLLTGGQYEEGSLARDFSVTGRETGSLAGQPLATVSQGTADQLYLALRLAVADLLLPYPGIAPLVMDDALTNFDDDRLDLALGCLTRLSGDRQVILFTCQRREPDRLDGQDNVTVLRLNGF